MCGSPDIPKPPPPPPPPAPPAAPTDIRDPVTDPALANQAAEDSRRRTGRSKLRVQLGSTRNSGGSGLAVRS